jgi:membrane protease YdiL (CAAX protease family)
MATYTTTQPAASPLKQGIIRHPLVAFFVLAFAISWSTVFPLALSRNVGVGLLPYDLPDAVTTALYLVASFIGPSLAAVIVLATTEGRPGVTRLLKRCVQWRVQPRWYVVALSANLLIWLLSYSALIGPRLFTAAVQHWPLLFTTFLPYVAFGILIPSIAEEPGWRGFALPHLQQRYGPLAASLLLGLLHGLWHIPALMSLLGPTPLANYPPFMLTAMMTAVLYTWVYNHTAGSVLLAMLFHAAGNAATGWLTALFRDAGLQEPRAGVAGFLTSTTWINVIGYGLAALLLVVLTRGRLGASTVSGGDDESAHR